MSTPGLKTIQSAFRGFYTPAPPGNVVLEGPALLEALEKLPALSVEPHIDTILVQLQRHYQGTSLNQSDQAVLAFIDDSITRVLRHTDLDFKIEAFVRDLAPLIAVQALKTDVRAVLSPLPVTDMVDLIISECLGWSEDLGILGEQFIEKLEVIVRSMVNGRTTFEECEQQLDAFFKKEHGTQEKMEERLLYDERKVLAGQKARYHAAELLNHNMTGKQLPLFIIFMLQGSWYEILQEIFVRFGEDSKEWEDAGNLTDALIWSIAPQTDRQKQLALIDELPGKIRQFAGAAKLNPEMIEQCLGDVLGEYEGIKTDSPSPPCDFDLIEVDATMHGANQRIASETYQHIKDLSEGQWFLYDDKSEPDEKVARLRLVLNWQETDQLLFTNHNRRKIMQMSYTGFAGHLSNETVKPLSLRRKVCEVIKEQLQHVIDTVQNQKTRELEEEEVDKRKQVSREYLSGRKAQMLNAMAELKKRAKRKQKRAAVLRQKAERKLGAARDAVARLRVDAWVKLPIMEGTLTPCRLVAIIPKKDNYIFANRAGIKVAEYTAGQLAHMIITENSEILDTGAEFENVLASVVTGLRENKSKSYEELTGDAS